MSLMNSHHEGSIMKKRITIFLILIIFSSSILSAQEILKSAEEDYFDLLALQGLTDRPTLNYRTLSDSTWSIKEDNTHLWQEQNLGTWHDLFGDFRLRAYGPELFMSGNTAAPYGQNDGVLWQGRGMNLSLKGGVRFEGYGIELTILPQLAFSQNVSFDTIKSSYSGSDFVGKAEKYGYYGVRSIDAPQRFGDKPFFDWDFGDSEIRYSWRTLTIGFGTQALWLGPAQINPIINSNNAPSYPKLDIGLRRQKIVIPRLGWHLGDIEFRIWWGYLSESNFFDNDSSNDHNLLSGISIAYGFPYFLKGLTIGFNRIMLSKWNDMSTRNVFSLIWPFFDDSVLELGKDKEDQRMSITLDYLLPIAGINVYVEFARNDYSPGIDYVVRYPFHTLGYTFGIKKSFNFSFKLNGEILLEITDLDCSQDYDRLIPWYSTFYAHHIITQGHTNRGQWLGAGIGTGGNSQYLGFRLYYPKGYGNIFFQRINPDLDYTWFIDSKNNSGSHAEKSIRTFIDVGISNLYYIKPYLSVFSAFVFRLENNPLNDDTKTSFRYNVNLTASVKYSL